MTVPTRDELIHALREHGGECSEWVFDAAADMLETDGRAHVRIREYWMDQNPYLVAVDIEPDGILRDSADGKR